MQLKKIAVLSAKIGASVAILGYLGFRAASDPGFSKLLSGPKDWTYLAAAWFAVLAAVLLTIFRWRLLVRALDMPLTAADALRIGFVSYAFNLAASMVGGDALKAAFLIHLQPNRKTEAVATIVIDRAMGLWALLILAAGASFMLDLSSLSVTGAELLLITRLCQLVRVLAVVTSIGLALLFVPGFTTLKLWDRLEHVPAIGKALHKLVAAVRVYRQQPGRLIVALAMSLGIHTLYSLMVYFIALGLRSPHPPLASHFVIVPLSMVAGTLPVGGIEVVLDTLYRAVAGPSVPEQQGFLIALAYRVIQTTVASVGVAFYLVGRREVKQLLEEAKEVSEHDPLDAPLAEPAK